MPAKRATRLTRTAWLHAGIEMLRDQGSEMLKAEPMARHLQTTKGSFYWHFKDVADFQISILAMWEEAADVEIARVMQTEEGDVPRLRALAQSLADPAQHGTVLQSEPAVRSWASIHAPAHDAVTRIDAQRIDILERFLSNIGIGNPEVAHMIYAASVGMSVTSHEGRSGKSEAIGSLVDLVLALR